MFSLKPGPLRTAAKNALTGYVKTLASWRNGYSWLLVMSHMRSGSSLLTHLLFNNPEIAGYGETHTTYRSHNDLYVLLAKVSYQLRTLPRLPASRYILDKLLHNILLTPDGLELFAHEDTRTIFLLRDPQQALASVISTLDYSVDGAVRYYSDRLSALTRYAQAMPASMPAFALTYRQLVEETDLSLAALTSFLELKIPLTSEYQVHRLTGQPGVGDISENIFAGRVLAQPSRDTEVSIPASSLAIAQREYEACWRAMADRCRMVGAPTEANMSGDATVVP